MRERGVTTIPLLQCSASRACCVWKQDGGETDAGKHSSSSFSSSGEVTSLYSGYWTSACMKGPQASWYRNNTTTGLLAHQASESLLKYRIQSMCAVDLESHQEYHTASLNLLVSGDAWLPTVLRTGHSFQSTACPKLCSYHQWKPILPLCQLLKWYIYCNHCLPADSWWTAFKVCAIRQWATPLSTWQWDISWLFTVYYLTLTKELVS